MDDRDAVIAELDAADAALSAARDRFRAAVRAADTAGVIDAPIVNQPESQLLPIGLSWTAWVRRNDVGEITTVGVTSHSAAIGHNETASQRTEVFEIDAAG